MDTVSRTFGHTTSDCTTTAHIFLLLWKTRLSQVIQSVLFINHILAQSVTMNSSTTTTSSRMLFSPRSLKQRASKGSIQGPQAGVPVAYLSQGLLAQQVSVLLNERQELGRQIEKRDHLLEYAKLNCKKRFIPSLAERHSALQQASHSSDRVPPKRTDWLFLGENVFGQPSPGRGVEVLMDESDDDDAAESDRESDLNQRMGNNHADALAQNSDSDVPDNEVESDGNVSDLE